MVIYKGIGLIQGAGKLGNKNDFLTSLQEMFAISV